MEPPENQITIFSPLLLPHFVLLSFYFLKEISADFCIFHPKARGTSERCDQIPPNEITSCPSNPNESSGGNNACSKGESPELANILKIKNKTIYSIAQHKITQEIYPCLKSKQIVFATYDLAKASKRFYSIRMFSVETILAELKDFFAPAAKCFHDLVCELLLFAMVTSFPLII